MPSLSSRWRTFTRSDRSAMKRLRPRPSAISGSLRASTSRISPQPLVMNRFTPLRYQLPCSSWKARRRTACRSLPASGSVSTIAPVTSPRQNSRQRFVLDFVVGEGVDRLGDALQAEHVHQRGVGPADHFGGHRVDEAGAIQPAVLARQGEAHQVGLGEPLEVLLHQRVQRDGAVVVERVAFAVDLLGVGGDHFAGHLADDLQHAAVVVHGVGRVLRRVAGGIVGRVDEAVLLDPGQLGQIDMVEEELDVVVIEKEIRHGKAPRGTIAKPQAATVTALADCTTSH